MKEAWDKATCSLNNIESTLTELDILDDSEAGATKRNELFDKHMKSLSDVEEEALDLNSRNYLRRPAVVQLFRSYLLVSMLLTSQRFSTICLRLQSQSRRL